MEFSIKSIWNWGDVFHDQWSTDLIWNSVLEKASKMALSLVAWKYCCFAELSRKIGWCKLNLYYCANATVHSNFARWYEKCSDQGKYVDMQYELSIGFKGMLKKQGTCIKPSVNLIIIVYKISKLSSVFNTNSAGVKCWKTVQSPYCILPTYILWCGI